MEYNTRDSDVNLSLKNKLKCSMAQREGVGDYLAQHSRKSIKLLLDQLIVIDTGLAFLCNITAR